MSTPQWSSSTQDVAAARRRSAGHEIVIGLVLLLVGIIITAATYNAVKDTGGHYMLAYGPIAVGVIKIVRGLVRLSG